MSCFQLIFTSHAAVEVTEELLLDILVSADTRNRTKGISGLLLYSQGRFMQLIEARRQETVEALFAKIEQDARHTHVEVLLRQESHEMHMAAWAMGFCMSDREYSAIRERSFYIHMDEVTQICASMSGPVGQYFCSFLGLKQSHPA